MRKFPRPNIHNTTFLQRINGARLHADVTNIIDDAPLNTDVTPLTSLMMLHSSLMSLFSILASYSTSSYSPSRSRRRRRSSYTVSSPSNANRGFTSLCQQFTSLTSTWFSNSLLLRAITILAKILSCSGKIPTPRQQLLLS